MALAFALTMFLSALLLFLVQPMIAKMILPKFGGTPAVWNTCMVFFQAALLAGYSYAHWTTARLGPRQQSRLHTAVLFLPLLLLPLFAALTPFVRFPLRLDPDWAPPGEAHPIPWVLLLLLLTVGLPFFVMSTTAPLLQKWFADTGHPNAKDPYFLYAASNLGSMVSLLGYPAVVEPYLALPTQGGIWLAGYGVLVLAVAGCAVLLRRTPPPVLGTGGGHGGSNPSAAGHAAEAAGKAKKSRHMPAESPAASLAEDVTPWTRCRWVMLAFVPSSLMLGVTDYLTTDIAAIPLLWIIPLTLYLLSFILVFSTWPQWLHKGVVLLLPVFILLLAFTMESTIRPSRIWMTFTLHLVTLFLTCLVCHGELALYRPTTRYLTEFYLWMSVGGVLGGLFNALVSPLAFRSIVEYPTALTLAAMVMPALAADKPSRFGRALDLGLPVVVCLLVAALLFRRWWNETLDLAAVGNLLTGQSISFWVVVVLGGLAAAVYVMRGRRSTDDRPWSWSALLDVPNECLDRVLDLSVALGLGILTAIILVQATDWELTGLREFLSRLPVPERFAWLTNIAPAHLIWGIAYGLPALFCYIFVERPVRFGLCVAGFFVAATAVGRPTDRATVLHQERTFFGVLRVREDATSIELMHGTTLHGEQFKDPKRRGEALTYYHRTGPIGQVFTDYEARQHFPPLAFIGLGTGTLASYGHPGQEVDFYEIDKAVVRIARNPEWFTYLTDAENRGVRLNVILGDARLQLARAPSGRYGLIVVDAFSSDAIPVHLITLQALTMYLDKLTPDGVVAFHISNRHLDLEPVLINFAHELGLACIGLSDDDEDQPGKSRSHWVLLARRQDAFGGLNAKLARWPDDRDRPWVDLVHPGNAERLSEEDVARWKEQQLQPLQHAVDFAQKQLEVYRAKAAADQSDDPHADLTAVRERIDEAQQELQAREAELAAARERLAKLSVADAKVEIQAKIKARWDRQERKRASVGIWTDDFSNLLRIFYW
ncbi:MAG: fused MFS/spermidine synthase [Gemmataceae bacterium]|nr:fused MFS/spermidine synthase [Gemmataceae bacterium]MDW8266874.1 fused MFS/spermidine synthase [Gemmataceae bacterium]